MDVIAYATSAPKAPLEPFVFSQREVGPHDIGIGGVTGRAGGRLRISMETYDMKSIRPMAGVIFHF